MIQKTKNIAAAVLIAIFLFSPFTAIPARAQWVDISTAAKDYGLDSLAWILVNKTIERMAASTVNWINTGFKGSPAYVTNPEAFFQDTADKVAGQFIYNNPNWKFLCGPISAKIRIALTKNYIQEENWQCTLTDIGKNLEDFMNDFDNGGWENFFELTQRDQNNPIGSYLRAESELNIQIANKQRNLSADLNQGGGFLSYKKCKRYFSGTN
jgi:hypothetical protein